MIGQRLGHYEILRKLGEGGMGEVYQALDTRLHRQVALKLLPPHLAGDSKRLERLRREAKIVANLNDPHIVTLYAVEEIEGFVILVLELVEGQTLDELIPDEGFEFAPFIRLALPIARALAAAHERGIAHRDLKPTNVMVDRLGRAKVLDFGVAKETLQPGADSDLVLTAADTELLLTGDGNMVGTVPYMSPEQLRGEPLTASADLFSVGVVFHEMLTGHRPFRGVSRAELMSAILRDEPPSIRESKPGLPVKLERIVRSCLEKNPAQRIASAARLVEALDSLRMEVETGTISRPLGIPMALRPSTERRVRRLGVLAVLLVGTAVGAWSWYRGSASARSASAAGRDVRLVVMPFANTGQASDAELVQGLQEEIHSGFVSVRGLTLVADLSVRQLLTQGKTARQIGEVLGATHLLNTAARWEPNNDRVHIRAELVDAATERSLWWQVYESGTANRAEIHAQIAEDVARELRILRPEEQVRVAKLSTSHDATRVYLRGLALKKEDDLGAASAAFENAVALDPMFAAAWAELAIVRSQIFHVNEKREDFRSAAEAALAQAKALAPGDPLVVKSEGMVLVRVRGDYPRARSILERSLTLFPNDPELLQVLAMAQLRQDDWVGAIARLEGARLLDPSNPQLLSRAGQMLLFARRFDLAQQRAEEARALAPRLAPALVTEWDAILARTGDLRAAQVVLDRARESLPAEGAAEGQALRETIAWLDVLMACYRRDFVLARESWYEYIRVAGSPLEPATTLSIDELWVGALIHERLGLGAQFRPVVESTYRESLRSEQESPDPLGAAFHVAASSFLLGRPESAQRFVGERLAELESLPTNSRWMLIERIARLLTAMGRPDEALDLLRRCVSAPYGSFLTRHNLLLDPSWDSLRQESSWQQLLDLGGVRRS